MANRLDIVRFYLGRLGKAGLAGVILLAGSLIFMALIIQPKEAALRERIRRNEVERLSLAAQQASTSLRDKVKTQQLTLAPEAPDALRRLFDAASHSGLELVQGEYRLIDVKDARLRRYQLLLPVYGQYPEIRTFLAKALNHDPALALTAIQLRRDVIESTDMEAVLNFTLYLESIP